MQNDDPKDALLGKTKAQLETLAADLGLPRFAAGQLADWLYKKSILTVDEMTNLSAAARAKLAERCELGLRPPSQVRESADGTKKYLYPTLSGKFIESAWIPEPDRSTLCVSTQVGCKMGCVFCMTGKQGFQANLTAGEIINQLRSLPERERVNNIVYMGMGEPLDNLDAVLDSLEILNAPWGVAMGPRRITVSTIGLLPALESLLQRSECHVAISLHTPFDDERQQLMPIQRVHPIRDIIDTLKRHTLSRQRRIFFEYILFKGLNDTPRHVNELARLLNGLRCRINLIHYHTVPGAPIEGSDEMTVKRFNTALNGKGITTTTRRSRGLDIDAACGLLSTRALVKPPAE